MTNQALPTYKHVRIDDDTLQPLNAIAWSDDAMTMPYDWATAGITAKVDMETETGTPVLADVTSGVTAHPTQTFTAEADDDRITCNGHGLAENTQIVVANSGGALPTGLSASTRYFAVNVTPNKFSLSTEPNGAVINLTTDGTGTNTFYVVGSIQYDFSSVAAGTVGLFRLWFKAVDGSSEVATFPSSEFGIAVQILPKGN